jgi:hypothetical protein
MLSTPSPHKQNDNPTQHAFLKIISNSLILPARSNPAAARESDVSHRCLFFFIGSRRMWHGDTGLLRTRGINEINDSTTNQPT